MNVVQCRNGHWFDGDEYVRCPFCGEGLNAPAPAPAPVAQPKPKEEKGFFGKLFNKRPKEAETVAADFSGFAGGMQNPPMNPPANNYNQIPAKEAEFFGEDDPTEGFFDTSAVDANPGFDTNGDNETVGIVEDNWIESDYEDFSKDSAAEQQNPVQEPVPAPPVKNNADNAAPAESIPDVPPMRKPQVNAAPVQNPPEVKKADNIPPVKKEKPAADNAASAGSQVPLSQMIKNISANSEGKTTGYFSSMSKSKEKAGSAQSSSKSSSEPVAGWLVAVSGPHFGESFCIYSGKNSLGRSADNSICLENDMSVSRNRHATIIFEPKKKKFYVQPGESSGLTYLNDDDVFDIKPLSAKDIIETGETKLMFVPLCDKTFSWEDYISKE